MFDRICTALFLLFGACGIACAIWVPTLGLSGHFLIATLACGGLILGHRIGQHMRRQCERHNA